MAKKTKKKNNISIENRKAYYDYKIEETLECGIELSGNEIKSIRHGYASIKESWAVIENGQLYIKQMHITKWDTSNMFDIDEDRVRKLLAHKKEIRELFSKVQKEGYTLVPLRVYIDNNNRCKVLIALAKGRHNYDKRHVANDKQTQLDINRALRGK